MNHAPGFGERPRKAAPARPLHEELLTMTGSKKALTVMLLPTMLGLWGCSQGTAPNPGTGRLRELEAKTARLEDDVKAALAARDQARRKVTVLEEQQTHLSQQLEQLERTAKERDELKELIAS